MRGVGGVKGVNKRKFCMELVSSPTGLFLSPPRKGFLMFSGSWERDQWHKMRIILKSSSDFWIQYNSINFALCSFYTPKPISVKCWIHIETSHLIYSAYQITGFYAECNAGLKWVNF